MRIYYYIYIILQMSNITTIQTKTNTEINPVKKNIKNSDYQIIKKVFNREYIKVLIDTENIETAAFFNQQQDKNKDVASNDSSNDTRSILNTEHTEIWKFLNRIKAHITYKSSGSTGHFFEGDLPYNNERYYFAMKVTAYVKHPEYGSIYEITRPENTELAMVKALSYFFVTKQTPHLILPIKTFYSGIEPFLQLLGTEKDYIVDNKDRYKKFIERYNNGKYEKTVSILISELASHGDFLDFIKKNYKNFKLMTWKIFFFQILSVLAVIQSKYPSFRHNDLKANNILVHKANNGKGVADYKVCNKHYVVPQIRYIIKLWDFDFACIPNVIENIKVREEWTKQINITATRNQYYDIHYFFNTLMHKGFFPEIITDTKHIDAEVKAFVRRIVPHEYRVLPNANEKGRLLINDPNLPSPQKILETDPFFDVFREK